MKELFSYLFAFDLRALFLKPTSNALIQMFRYLFVGGIAFVVDGGSLWVVHSCFGVHYLIATALAFLFGLTANFFLARSFVFKGNHTSFNAMAEFISYAVIGLIGLALTMGLMYLGVDVCGLPVMLTKCIAVALVLVWNFAARKIFIYKDKKDGVSHE